MTELEKRALRMKWNHGARTNGFDVEQWLKAKDILNQKIKSL